MNLTKKNETTDQLPPSASNFGLNFICLAIYLSLLLFLQQNFKSLGIVPAVILSLLGACIPLLIFDLFIRQSYHSYSSGLFTPPGKSNPNRILTKLIGLYSTLLIILTIYILNPIYRSNPKSIEFYQTYFDFLKIVGPWVLLLSPLYFWEIDRRQKNPHDGYWHMGCLVSGRITEINKNIIWEYFRSWFIKGFFLPIMFASLILYSKSVIMPDHNLFHETFYTQYIYLLNLLYMIDILYGTLGYFITSRLLNNHIQSTEPTWPGWLMCLACYHPFTAIFGTGLFPFDDGFNWDQWFALFPISYYVCGIAIIFLSAINAFATVAFGYRMSNLTYRGIITTGPYRYTKHPAYICKVASWWLISLPFFSIEGHWVALLNTFNLSVITYIYYLRAKTEENHLSNYPEYVAYANWIKKNGIFCFITKYFPSMQYSEEKCKKAKSIVWFKKLGMQHSD